MENKRLPVLCRADLCTGCGACDNLCPTGAISLVYQNGFKHPEIDNEKCIGCLACERSCPITNPKSIENFASPHVYAAWHIDEDIRKESSSGGAFSALAMAILQNGGCVAGAAYDENMMVNHILIDKIEQLPLLRGSKYVQCSINNNYKQVREKLRQGVKVLFVGTPCQISGLRSFLRKEYDNLYCCDFICHGVPSPLLFGKYLKWFEEKYNCKVSAFNFRSKLSGWYDALRVANGKVIAKGSGDAYFLGFNRNITLRESCYNCPSIGLPRKGDNTIADFWGIGRIYRYHSMSEIEKGISLIMANNDKGEELVKLASHYLYIEERSLDEALAGNKPMVTPSSRPKERDTFYSDMEHMDFDNLSLKYFKLSGKSKLVAWVRENMPRSFMVMIRSFSQFVKYKKNGSKCL